MSARPAPVTYCTNIHPGESWDETRRNLEAHTLAVKAAVCPDDPFPVGLRVSGLASRQVDGGEALRFKDWMGEHGLYVATVNGFPFGTFHGTPVKSGVYLPDWRDPARLEYTLRLAELLAVWLPEGMDGSISSVPVGFTADFDLAQEGMALATIGKALEGLDRIAQRTGKLIRLSVEPEPGCLVETTPQLVSLFERLALPENLRAHLAACYDCCHQALQFEDPAWSLTLLADNAIEIGHVQVSSALNLPCPALSCLSRFDEPVYLHQCVFRDGSGKLERFDDLGQALGWVKGVPADPSPRPDFGGAPSWRVHFHLPVFLEELSECSTTQAFLRDFLPLVPAHVPLEVETYTFSVLPKELQTPTVVESIVREIEWVEACRRG
ncbi:metabolite traffic protein EboE [Fundidesulfovibrio terrae]|uniref:metabolite traffic protein EboE n=1 Tax=Fundidesulfovibrio terrae TaxID=2922866 RepID=UPI001FAE7628